jgi:hypothetical protein
MEWNIIYGAIESKMDSPELRGILDMIQVAMTRIETAEMGIRFMTVSSLAPLSSR